MRRPLLTERFFKLLSNLANVAGKHSVGLPLFLPLLCKNPFVLALLPAPVLVLIVVLARARPAADPRSCSLGGFTHPCSCCCAPGACFDQLNSRSSIMPWFYGSTHSMLLAHISVRQFVLRVCAFVSHALPFPVCAIALPLVASPIYCA